MKNFEIKYQISSWADIHTFLSNHHDFSYQWSAEQNDIYFRVPRGRLKLRLQIDTSPELIFYQRPDSKECRESVYDIYFPSNADLLKQILEKTLGVKSVIHKKRSLFMFRNVRIHLDQVTELGNFMEFESVIDDKTDEETARRNLQDLMSVFSSFDLVPVEKSYTDLQDDP